MSMKILKIIKLFPKQKLHLIMKKIIILKDESFGSNKNLQNDYWYNNYPINNNKQFQKS